MTNHRVDDCYELMDTADDCSEIHQHAAAQGHIALIDPNPRRDQARKQWLADEAQALKAICQTDPAKERYKQHSSAGLRKSTKTDVSWLSNRAFLCDREYAADKILAISRIRYAKYAEDHAFGHFSARPTKSDGRPIASCDHRDARRHRMTRDAS